MSRWPKGKRNAGCNEKSLKCCFATNIDTNIDANIDINIDTNIDTNIDINIDTNIFQGQKEIQLE